MNQAKNLLQKFSHSWRRFCRNCQINFRRFRRFLQRLRRRLLRRFTHWLDPKLEPYRTHSRPCPSSTQPAQSATVHPPQETMPNSTAELLTLLRRLPTSILTDTERQNIIAAINFPQAKVADLMLPNRQITYVQEDTTLGPLVLDQLYRSGFQHFPVKNSQGKITGVIHTTALNHLDTKTTPEVRDLVDPTIYYLRSDYSLSRALAAFLRTNCFFFLVINRQAQVVGLLTYQMLIQYLLGSVPQDDFDHDTDRTLVAQRQL